MHKKFGPKGLVVVSLSVEDELQDAKHEEKVLAFLKKTGAAFRNYILDEPGEVWAEKFGTGLRPFLFVFDRNGRWKRFDANDLDEKDGDLKVEKLIEDWLSKK